ncbi:cell division protein ZipA [Algibacillus agarilyticus]|uniref:cell division protein ZipA n=1 Tax=Algibacillus agarilyticus TaxID=2234133 RepID=UPI000DD0CEC2|nr:cell division protein ZipA [Algibacillus agarilyticus]
MDDFRIVLMILGILAVLALVAHGIWTVRKNNQSSIEPPLPDEKQPKHSSKDKKSAGFSLKSKIDSIKPEQKTESKDKVRVEPNFDDVQLEMELPDEMDSFIATETETPQVQTHREEKMSTTTEQSASEPAEQHTPEEVLILNVIAPEGQVISGASLLPFLLTLGFKFGDMAIFHRYEESSGDGEILFSLANMFNPGTFDIDNMEHFTSPGVSLFMSLPTKSDASQVFNMMHNASKKIAAEFNGQVLDGQRSVLTRQTVQHYIERIREFERRQLLK